MKCAHIQLTKILKDSVLTTTVRNSILSSSIILMSYYIPLVFLVRWKHLEHISITSQLGLNWQTNKQIVIKNVVKELANIFCFIFHFNIFIFLPPSTSLFLSYTFQLFSFLCHLLSSILLYIGITFLWLWIIMMMMMNVLGGQFSGPPSTNLLFQSI